MVLLKVTVPEGAVVPVPAETVAVQLMGPTSEGLLVVTTVVVGITPVVTPTVTVGDPEIGLGL
jgi:hypothetical protein